MNNSSLILSVKSCGGAVCRGAGAQRDAMHISVDPHAARPPLMVGGSRERVHDEEISKGRLSPTTIAMNDVDMRPSQQAAEVE